MFVFATASSKPTPLRGKRIQYVFTRALAPFREAARTCGSSKENGWAGMTLAQAPGGSGWLVRVRTVWPRFRSSRATWEPVNEKAPVTATSMAAAAAAGQTTLPVETNVPGVVSSEPRVAALDLELAQLLLDARADVLRQRMDLLAVRCVVLGEVRKGHRRQEADAPLHGLGPEVLRDGEPAAQVEQLLVAGQSAADGVGLLAAQDRDGDDGDLGGHGDADEAAGELEDLVVAGGAEGAMLPLREHHDEVAPCELLPHG